MRFELSMWSFKLCIWYGWAINEIWHYVLWH